MSLVGIYPDNVRVSPPLDGQAPVLPTLAIYTRVRIDIEATPFTDTEWRLMSPSGQKLVSHLFNAAFIEESAEGVREAGNEYATLVVQTKASPFVINEIGRYVAVVNFEGEDHFAGALRLSYHD